MIVRIALILGIIFFTSSYGTSQHNNNNQSDSTHIALNPTLKANYNAQIKAQYEKLLGKNFSGEIIVAKDGEVVFEDYKGFSNFEHKTPITSETPIHLASISKTFTGMAILKLWELHLLDLSDPVTKFLPSFHYAGVTIEQLLSHRSGLPDYTHIMDPSPIKIIKTKTKRGKWITKKVKDPSIKPYKQSNYNDQDVLNFLIEKQPTPQSPPNTVFKYCNTNFVILALIIEQISGEKFPDFMEKTIFLPLKMEHSYIYSENSKHPYLPSYNERTKPYKIEKYDYIYGDKNVYSTVNDMLLWDKALRSEQFLSKTTLSMAYEPKSQTTKYFQNYGFAWRMLMVPDQEKIIYHNGWWHGNNTVFARLLKDSATIIILGNKTYKNIYKGEQFFSVFTGKVDSTELEQ